MPTQSGRGTVGLRCNRPQQSQCSSIDIVTRVRAGQPRNRVSISGKEKEIFSGCGFQQVFSLLSANVLFPSDCEVKLIISPSRAKARNERSYSSALLYVFVV